MEDTEYLIEERDGQGNLTAVEILLTEPVTAYGQEKSRLRLAAPTGKLRRKIGNPYVIAAGGVDVLPERVAQYAATMAKVPPMAFDEVGMEDFNRIEAAVLLFFGERKQAATPNG